MTIFEIEKLIADFYEGKTSVDQEKEIMHFLRLRKCLLIYWQKKSCFWRCTAVVKI